MWCSLYARGVLVRRTARFSWPAHFRNQGYTPVWDWHWLSYSAIMGKPVPSCDAHSFCAGMLFDVLPSSRIGNTKASSNTTTHEACGDNHKIVGSDTHSGDGVPPF